MRLSFILSVFFGVVFFQNCQQAKQSDLEFKSEKFSSFQVEDQSSMLSEEDQNSDQLPASEPPPQGLTAEQEKKRQVACLENMIPMEISNPLALTSLSIDLNSGLGTANSGDSLNTKIFSYNVQLDSKLGSVNKLLELPLAQQGMDCKYIRRVVVDVVNDKNFPFNLSYALNAQGENMALDANVARKIAVVRNVMRQNPATSVNEISNGQSAIEFKFQIQFNQNNRRFYCAEADFYYRIRSQVVSLNLSNQQVKESKPVFIKVKLHNTCNTEKKLISKEMMTDVNASFGSQVSLYENWAAVLAPKQTRDGALFLYQKDANDDYVEKQVIKENDSDDKPFSKFVIKNDLLLISRASKNQITNTKLYENVGSVYVYKLNRNTNHWDYLQEIRPEKNELVIAHQFFGQGIEIINQDTIAISAPQLNRNGRVYLYHYSVIGSAGAAQATANTKAFTRKTTLIPTRDQFSFGYQMLAGKDHFFISAPGDVVNNSVRGAVHFYPYKTFANNTFLDIDSLKVKSINPKTTEVTIGGRFGFAMALSGKNLAISAPLSAGGRGAVLFYKDYTEPNIQVSARLQGPQNKAIYYGNSLSMNSKRIFIGCPECASRLGYSTGVVEIRDLSALLAANLTTIRYFQYSHSPVQGENFGRSVYAAESDEFIVGSPGKSLSVLRQGFAQVYKLK
jgi:hypothetical protein